MVVATTNVRQEQAVSVTHTIPNFAVPPYEAVSVTEVDTELAMEFVSIQKTIAATVVTVGTNAAVAKSARIINA